MGLFGKKSISKKELKQKKETLDSLNTRKTKIGGTRKQQEKLINKEYERLAKIKNNEFYFDSTKTKVIIDANFVRITRKGLGNKITIGSSGEKAIRIDSISSVQLKEPKLTSGYIQFTLSGNSNSQGVLDAAQDENSILFIKQEIDIATMIKEKVESLLAKPGLNIAQRSSADEIRKYKELLDDGIISQEEFDKKKASILNS